VPSYPEAADQDVPRLGIVRPPLVYLAAILLGVAIQWVSPRPFLPRSLAVPVGASLVVIAVALFVSAVARFRASGTPVPAREPTTAIVRSGPYRLSRNPIYLAFSLFQLGIAVWVDSVWLLATLVVAVGLMNYVVIPKEERYLDRRFGSQYLEYKASVRRWL
jgi:protein-S-isoprenylcysteine O-methyltransferase Ste14